MTHAMADIKKIHYLGDPKASPQEIDWLTSDIKSTSLDEMLALAEAADKAFRNLLALIRPHITLNRARSIREFRRTCSFRAIAQVTYLEWGDKAKWNPPYNQLAGMALCEISAGILGEDQTQDPWDMKPPDLSSLFRKE
jgi:hypothetical protein